MVGFYVLLVISYAWVNSNKDKVHPAEPKEDQDANPTVASALIQPTALHPSRQSRATHTPSHTLLLKVCFPVLSPQMAAFMMAMTCLFLMKQSCT